jgi:ABC-2 type transport system ATP-binding protein
VAVIEVDGLCKAYDGRPAVDGVSFQVERGEIFGVLGPNGAGKTTTVECVQGLRTTDAGRLEVLGLDPQRNQREVRRRIGSQLQESALPDRLKVWEALDLFASVSKQGPDWRTLLETWGLAEQADQSFASLSGGQRQRLFVALALVNEPEIVFLDELTQGLDPAARRMVWGLIREIRDRGVTVVLVTHYMDEVEHLCDRVVIIDHGRVLAQGTPHQLISAANGMVTVRFSTELDVSWLEGLRHVTSVQRQGRRSRCSAPVPCWRWWPRLGRRSAPVPDWPGGLVLVERGSSPTTCELGPPRRRTSSSSPRPDRPGRP